MATNRAKQPAEFSPHDVAGAMLKGLSNWRSELAISAKEPLLQYNFNKRGDDRQSLETNANLVAALLDLNPAGVWRKKTLMHGWEVLDSKYKGGIVKGMFDGYCDSLTYVVNKLFTDIGRIRRRRPSSAYPEWLETLLAKIEPGDPRGIITPTFWNQSLCSKPPHTQRTLT